MFCTRHTFVPNFIRESPSCVEKCVISCKRVKKVAYLLKIFNSGALKVIKTCPAIKFLGLFLPEH